LILASRSESLIRSQASNLAKEEDGRYQFQYWALSKFDARLVDQDKKKGSDRGVDGRAYFHDDTAKSGTKGPSRIKFQLFIDPCQFSSCECRGLIV
jgi:hypothetical protein